MTTTLATGSKRFRHHDGFTLLELGIVMMIMAVLIALAAPSFVRSYRNMLLSETGRTFGTTCQLARLNAVFSQRIVLLHLDMARQSYWITQPGTNTETDSETVTLKSVQLDPRILLVSARPEFSGKPDEGGSLLQIGFYPNGTCDGAEIQFRSRDEANALTMHLDPMTAGATP